MVLVFGCWGFSQFKIHNSKKRGVSPVIFVEKKSTNKLGASVSLVPILENRKRKKCFLKEKRLYLHQIKNVKTQVVAGIN
jgi:hypothetical protein